MRKAIILILLAVAIWSIPANEVTAGKVTVDPNTPAAKAAAEIKEIVEETDVALEKKLTYDGGDVVLPKMLEDITKLTGVKMQPSSSADNWQVRQRTAIVFVNNAPLSEFKDGLSNLFGYRWSRVTADNGQRTYFLREVINQRNARQNILDAEKQAEIDARFEGINAALDAAEKSQHLTPKELKDARKNDPWLYYLSSNTAGKKWAEVMQAVPDDWWQQVAEGKSKSVQVDKQDDAVTMKIIGLLEDIRTLSASGTASFGNDDLRQDPLAEFNIASMQQVTSGSVAALFYIYAKHAELINDGKDTTWSSRAIEMFPIGQSKSSGCMTAGYVHILREEGKPQADLLQLALDKSCDYFNAKRNDPESDAKTDPELLKEIEHKPIADPKKPDESNVVKHLRALAKETGFTIMMETFDDEIDACKTAWAPDKGKIFDILSAISLHTRSSWEKKGNVILFRYKEWPTLRALEVPNHLIKRWEDLAKAHDGLTFDDMADIVRNATYEQIDRTLLKNKLLSMAGVNNSMIRGPYYGSLRVLALLPDDATRVSFRSEMGVPVKLLRELPLDNDPITKISKDWYSTTYSTDPDATGGVVVEVSSDPYKCRETVKSFIRFSNGKAEEVIAPMECPSAIKEFKEYVKSLEKEAEKKHAAAEN